MMRYFQVGTNPFPEPAVVVDFTGAVLTPLAAVGQASGAARVPDGVFSTIGIALSAGDDSETLVDQLLAFRETIGDFGTLLYAGHDWVEPRLARRSMELMAEKVMPAVNAAIGKQVAAA